MADHASDGIAVFVGGQFFPCQADPLKDAYVVSDHAGFSDDGPGTMVDREMMADFGARMDVDAGFAVGHFGNDPRNIGYPQLIELMGDAVVADGPEAGVAEDDLAGVLRGRIAVERGFHIGSQNPADVGQRGDKSFGKADRLGGYLFFGTGHAGGIGKAETGVDLAGKKRVERLYVDAGMKTNGLLADARVSVIAGEENGATEIDHFFEYLSGRQRFLIAIGMEKLLVRSFVRQFFDGIAKCVTMLLYFHYLRNLLDEWTKVHYFFLYDFITVPISLGREKKRN